MIARQLIQNIERADSIMAPTPFPSLLPGSGKRKEWAFEQVGTDPVRWDEILYNKIGPFQPGIWTDL